MVERFFNKIKHFRKIATRFEITERNHLSAVLLACSCLRPRQREPAS